MNANCLINAGRNIETPFRLEVVKPGCGRTEIEFIEIFRLLPAKRIVALARHNGQLILVKTYVGKNASRNASREIRGIKRISNAGVRTTDLLWEATLPGNGQLLALEYLHDGIGLYDQLNRNISEADRISILSKVMKIMSRLHNHGVIQKDIHLANFLLSSGEIHTIDGGGIQQKSLGSLSENASMANLASFFAQFLARFDSLVPVVFVDYEEGRGWTHDQHRIDRLLSEINSHRAVRKRSYIDKTFRDCTRFVCRSSFRRFMVCERDAFSDEMQAVIENPDGFITDGRILKSGNTSTVALVHLVDRSLVIKRYNIKSVLHGLRRAFRKSRAWVSWSNAFRMEFLGIPSLKPVALIEDRIGPLRSTAYLVTEYIKGSDALNCLHDCLHNSLYDSSYDKENPNGELEALATILHKLSENQISHGDLKATNFLMTDGGPVIIDLDAMQEHRSEDRFARAFRSDLERFMENWQDNPELAHRFSDLLADLNRRYSVRTR